MITQNLISLFTGLGHLNSYRLDHHYLNCINHLCSCSFEVESLSHFFLSCHYFTNIHSTLLDEVAKIDSNILFLSTNEIVEALIYGNSNYDLNQNSEILNATINFVLKSERFSGPLFYKFCILCNWFNRKKKLSSPSAIFLWKMHSEQFFLSTIIYFSFEKIIHEQPYTSKKLPKKPYITNFIFSIYQMLTEKVYIYYQHVKKIYFSLVCKFILLFIVRWLSPKSCLTNYILWTSCLKK